MSWDDIDIEASTCQRRALYRWLLTDHDRLRDLIRSMTVDDARNVLQALDSANHRMMGQLPNRRSNGSAGAVAGKQDVLW